jgi:hypothetical protein
LVYHAEQRDDRGLVRGTAVKVTHRFQLLRVCGRIRGRFLATNQPLRPTSAIPWIRSRFGWPRRVSSGNRRASGLLLPIEIRTDIRARRPQAWQVKSGSISDSRTSSNHFWRACPMMPPIRAKGEPDRTDPAHARETPTKPMNRDSTGRAGMARKVLKLHTTAFLPIVYTERVGAVRIRPRPPQQIGARWNYR